jgi:hypothetical protein
MSQGTPYDDVQSDLWSPSVSDTDDPSDLSTTDTPSPEVHSETTDYNGNSNASPKRKLAGYYPVYNADGQPLSKLRYGPYSLQSFVFMQDRFSRISSLTMIIPSHSS